MVSKNCISNIKIIMKRIYIIYAILLVALADGNKGQTLRCYVCEADDCNNIAHLREEICGPEAITTTPVASAGIESTPTATMTTVTTRSDDEATTINFVQTTINKSEANESQSGLTKPESTTNKPGTTTVFSDQSALNPMETTMRTMTTETSSDTTTTTLETATAETNIVKTVSDATKTTRKGQATTTISMPTTSSPRIATVTDTETTYAAHNTASINPQVTTTAESETTTLASLTTTLESEITTVPVSDTTAEDTVTSTANKNKTTINLFFPTTIIEPVLTTAAIPSRITTDNNGPTIIGSEPETATTETVEAERNAIKTDMTTVSNGTETTMTSVIKPLSTTIETESRTTILIETTSSPYITRTTDTETTYSAAFSNYPQVAPAYDAETTSPSSLITSPKTEINTIDVSESISEDTVTFATKKPKTTINIVSSRSILSTSATETNNSDADVFGFEKATISWIETTPVVVSEATTPQRAAVITTNEATDALHFSRTERRISSLQTTIDNNRYILRKRRNAALLTYSCYSAEFQVNNQTKVKKGCVVVPIDKSSCQAVSENVGYRYIDGSCKVCTKDLCNSSSLPAHSTLPAVLIVLFVKFLM